MSFLLFLGGMIFVHLPFQFVLPLSAPCQSPCADAKTDWSKEGLYEMIP